VKRRTSLTFSDEDSVSVIEPVTNMVDSNDELWYSSEQIDHIKQHCAAMVKVSFCFLFFLWCFVFYDY
jgi:hypothetical protein